MRREKLWIGPGDVEWASIHVLATTGVPNESPPSSERFARIWPPGAYHSMVNSPNAPHWIVGMVAQPPVVSIPVGIGADHVVPKSFERRSQLPIMSTEPLVLRYPTYTELKRSTAIVSAPIQRNSVGCGPKVSMSWGD